MKTYRGNFANGESEHPVNKYMDAFIEMCEENGWNDIIKVAGVHWSLARQEWRFGFRGLDFYKDFYGWEVIPPGLEEWWPEYLEEFKRKVICSVGCMKNGEPCEYQRVDVIWISE
jgi:hypothetical protein